MHTEKLNIKRPLVFFDLETTGTNVGRDRIVEISMIKVFPDGSDKEVTMRLNPEMHIPEESTAVHHITDEDVATAPTFKEKAQELLDFMEGCDIAGYNSNKFDVPLLVEQFARVGIKFDMTNRKFVDVQNIFYAMEPRTLVAAYRFYCGKNLEEAHSANADTRATYEVLRAQIAKYDTLQNDIDYLASFSLTKNIDLAGRISRNDQGEPIFNFGKYKGQTVEAVFKKDLGYYNWMMQGDFPQNTKDVLTQLKFKFTKK
jgi:DNA polymerase-3 subunit epsilon